MPKKLKTYLVTEVGSEDRLVKASSELAVYRHVDHALKVSIPTKDTIIDLLSDKTVIEMADEAS